MQKNNIKFNLILVIITLFILTGITEAFFQVYYRWYLPKIKGVILFKESGIYPHARFLGFKLNSLGYHDREFQKQKSKNTFRILGIGDSFVFGVVPYRYNFLTLLEQKLNQNQNSKFDFEIFNMGVPAAGPKNYLQILKAHGSYLNPDLVIVHYFLGNDFEPPPPLEAKGDPLVTLFTPYFFATFIYPIFNTEDPTIIFHRNYIDSDATFEESTFFQIETDRLSAFKKNNKESSENFAHSVRELVKIKQFLSEKKFRYLLRFFRSKPKLIENC